MKTMRRVHGLRSTPPADYLYQAAEKVFVSVIPSEARNLLFAGCREKADSSGKNRPRNDTFGGFSATCPAKRGIDRGIPLKCPHPAGGLAILTFSNRAHVPSHVLVRFLDNEVVLLNLASEKYFGLDETGTRMWQLATTSPNIDTAYQELLAEYDVAPELLHDNLTKLLIELVENGLLEVKPADSIADVAPT